MEANDDVKKQIGLSWLKSCWKNGTPWGYDGGWRKSDLNDQKFDYGQRSKMSPVIFNLFKYSKTNPNENEAWDQPVEVGFDVREGRTLLVYCAK